MKKTFSIIIVALVVLTVGVCVVYHNTGSLIYEEVYVFSYNNDSITFLDYTLYFDDISNAVDKIRTSMPDKLVTFTFGIYNVYNYYIGIQ